jgi:LmbE family N-acetylglucosaminyl deacetylase
MPTIVPAIDEDTWLEQLADLPRMELPLVPTLVIAPHPDDETLGAGGLIAALRSQGVDVSVVAVTDGEHAYADAEPAALAAVREREQTAALARLGVPADKIHRLRFPDSDVTSFEPLLAANLRSLVRRGMHIVAPWAGDFHPDHEACGRAAASVAEEMQLPLTSYFFWTWHRGTPETLRGLPLSALELTPEQQRAKLDAIACHRSQLADPSGQPILSDELLAPARRTYEVFLR